MGAPKLAYNLTLWCAFTSPAEKIGWRTQDKKGHVYVLASVVGFRRCKTVCGTLLTQSDSAVLIVVRVCCVADPRSVHRTFLRKRISTTAYSDCILPLLTMRNYLMAARAQSMTRFCWTRVNPKVTWRWLQSRQRCMGSSDEL